MKHDRRKFLQISLGLLALPACVDRLANMAPPSEILTFGFGTNPNLNNTDRVYGISFLSDKGLRKIVLENEIHSIAHSPAQGLKVFLPKHGFVSYYQKGEGELKPISPAPGMQFYGHGVFDEKRNLFYSTQAPKMGEYDKQGLFVEGFIYVHNLDDFKIISKFPSFGFNPHDLLILDDELVVCNGGDHSNIAWIDLGTQKLVTKFECKDGEHISLGHITKLNQTTLMVASGSRRVSKPCLVYSVSKAQGLKLFEVPEGSQALMVSQVLSILCYKGFVLGTCPSTGNLFVWKENGTFLMNIAIPSAASLAISKNFDGVLIGSGDHERPIQLLKVHDGKIRISAIPWAASPTGSHSLIFTA